MGIRSVFKSGIGPQGIGQIAMSGNIGELVEMLDRAGRDNIPVVLGYLVDLSEYGWHDSIISYGTIPKAISLMENGPFLQRKRACLLISSMISHGRCDIVLSNVKIVGVMLDLLKEADAELKRTISYCISMFISMGALEEFLGSDGIEKIAPLTKSDDELTIYYTLFALNTLSSTGYQEEIMESGIGDNIQYHMKYSPEVEELAKQLLDDLYNWKEESFSIEEDEIEIIPDYVELIGVEDGYYRPIVKKSRIESRDGSLFGMNGKEIREEDEDIIVELKKPARKKVHRVVKKKVEFDVPMEDPMEELKKVRMEGVKGGTLSDISDMIGQEKGIDLDQAQSSSHIPI